MKKPAPPGGGRVAGAGCASAQCQIFRRRKSRTKSERAAIGVAIKTVKNLCKKMCKRALLAV